MPRPARESRNCDREARMSRALQMLPWAPAFCCKVPGFCSFARKYRRLRQGPAFRVVSAFRHLQSSRQMRKSINGQVTFAMDDDIHGIAANDWEQLSYQHPLRPSAPRMPAHLRHFAQDPRLPYP